MLATMFRFRNRPAFRTRQPPVLRLEAERCRLAEDVILVRDGEVCRLLDFRRGQFFALDETGTHMLIATLEAGTAAAVGSVAAAYGISPDIVRDDLGELLGRLEQDRLVKLAPVRAPQGAHCSRLLVTLLLTVAWISLRTLGWSRSVQLWGRWSRSAGRCCQAAVAACAAVADAVVTVVPLHPLRVQCKERALVSWFLLRRRGLAPELIVGIDACPFQAHVWVECDGHPIPGDPVDCSRFQPVLRYRHARSTP